MRNNFEKTTETTDPQEAPPNVAESREGFHTPIEKWLAGELRDIQPTRVDAVPVAECNLNCRHCFWPHHEINERGEKVSIRSPNDGNHWERQVEKIKELGVPVVYAGRIINERGERFIQECIDNEVPIGIVDNGYTILSKKYRKFLPHYQWIDISLDGAEAAHDEQRNKKGSFKRAWNSIIQLQRMGFGPEKLSVSTALSPISSEGWREFEEMLRNPERYGELEEGFVMPDAETSDSDWQNHDLRPIPMSVALSLSYPENLKRNEGEEKQAIYEGEQKASMIEQAFETLLSGNEKLINLYDLDIVKILKDRLKRFSWSMGSAGDSLATHTPEGSIIKYYPDSVITTSDLVLKWDGEFYHPWGKEFIKKDDFDPDIHGRQVNERNREEMTVWREILDNASPSTS